MKKYLRIDVTKPRFNGILKELTTTCKFYDLPYELEVIEEVKQNVEVENGRGHKC